MVNLIIPVNLGILVSGESAHFGKAGNFVEFVFFVDPFDSDEYFEYGHSGDYGSCSVFWWILSFLKIPITGDVDESGDFYEYDDFCDSGEFGDCGECGKIGDIGFSFWYSGSGDSCEFDDFCEYCQKFDWGEIGDFH